MVAAAGLILLLAAPGAQGSPADGLVNLGTEPHLRINGLPFEHGAGESVSGAGDVNGDGVPDLVVGQADADDAGRQAAGAAFVVFGRPSTGTVELESLGSQGFRIDGAAELDLAGSSVSGVGDVNGDGLDDVIVGSLGADNNGRPNSGSAYVVFGKASTARVDLAALGSQGFRIDGAATGDSLANFQARHSVSGAGDVNRDGLADVIVGTGLADNNGRPDSGSAYVVFGKRSTNVVDLAVLGSQGFRIDGPEAADHTSGDIAVSGAGDVNGDGVADVMVGLDFVGSFAGSAWVVFGRASSPPIDLAALGSQGFEIAGFRVAAAGNSVSGVGDLNRDGRDDVIVGAQTVDLPGRQDAGAAFVVFGKDSTDRIELASIGSAGFRIAGESREDRLGWSVSGAGDVNGDGRPDLLLGATAADFTGDGPNWNAGSAYVLYGKPDATPVDLAVDRKRGFRIDGVHAPDGAGWSVSGVGDMDGDGRDDVVVGAPDINSSSEPGSAHVVFSGGLPASVTLSPAQATNIVEDEHCVIATVKDANGSLAGGADVGFLVNSSPAGNSAAGSRTTDANGEATFCYRGPSLGPSTDVISAFADLDRDGARTAGEPSGSASKSWEPPAGSPGCRVWANGRIATSSGSEATFSGSSRATGAGASGHHRHTDRSRPPLFMQSTRVTAVVCAEDGNSGSVFGSARAGSATTLFRIDLRDGEDSYRLRLATGYDSGEQPLLSGKVKIRF